jgi:RNA polymerase sigma factor (sigma-70 family)
VCHATGAAWERFLAQLAPDPDQAGEQFAALRRRLVDLFRRRGLAAAEDLADETVERAVRQVAAGEEIRSLPGYLRGIAHLVALEAARREMRVAPLEDGDVPAGHAACGHLAAGHAEEEPPERLDSLDRCLERMPPRTRELVLRYYASGDGRIAERRQIADELGIGLNALRIRIHRLRAALAQCLSRSRSAGSPRRLARGTAKLPARPA